MSRVKSNIKKILLPLILKTKKLSVEESIIIFGDPRGGTTWLMELLSNIPKTCINWEPLNKLNVSLPHSIKWGIRPYIKEDDTNPQYLKMMRDILSLKKSNSWTNRYTTINTALKAETLIIKFIAANLVIPYLLKKFAFKHKPILLIRHPIDTSISHLKAFYQKEELMPVEIPDCINNERYQESFDFINSLNTNLERQIAYWCLHNTLTLNRKDVLKQVTIVFYYDLVLNPKEELKRIIESSKLSQNCDGLIDTIDLKKPSKTDFSQDLATTPEVQLNKNINKLSEAEKKNIQLIFDHFNFKLFDAFSVVPKKEYLT